MSPRSGPSRHYISGGTGGEHTLVSLTETEIERQIADTKGALELLGVGPGAVVLVAVPADPWSISKVFADATVRLGADVLAFGESAWHPSLASLIHGLRPTHVVSGPSVLRAAGAGAATATGIVETRPMLVSVGEALSPEAEYELVAAWGFGGVRRIYGVSALGTAAVQAAEEREWLVLNPGLEAALSSTGTLRLRPTGATIWIDTGDVAELRYPERTRGWRDGPEVRIVARFDDSIVLPDGTRMDQGAVMRVVIATGAAAAQCWTFSQAPATVWFVFAGVPAGKGAEDLVNAIRATLLEIASPARTSLLDLHVRLLPAASALLTPRQKTRATMHFSSIEEAEAMLTEGR